MTVTVHSMRENKRNAAKTLKDVKRLNQIKLSVTGSSLKQLTNLAPNSGCINVTSINELIEI